MWIHAPYFATSKRAEAPLGIGALACWAMLLLPPAGCLVTDTIEFEDEVNDPITVIAHEPADNLVNVCPGDRWKFSVTVWDPDADLNAPQIGGRVFLSSSRWEEPEERACAVPERVVAPELSEDIPGYKVTCSVNLRGVDEGELLELRVIVSDIGYTANTIKQDAHTVEVVWVLEVEKCD